MCIRDSWTRVWIWNSVIPLTHRGTNLIFTVLFRKELACPWNKTGNNRKWSFCNPGTHLTHAQKRKPHTANSHSFLKTATLIITNDKVAHPKLLLLIRPPQFFYLVPRVTLEGTIATGSKSHLYSVTCHCLFMTSIILISAQCGTHSPDVIWAE